MAYRATKNHSTRAMKARHMPAYADIGAHKNPLAQEWQVGMPGGAEEEEAWTSRKQNGGRCQNMKCKSAARVLPAPGKAKHDMWTWGSFPAQEMGPKIARGTIPQDFWAPEMEAQKRPRQLGQ